jgi:dephospho-CoA kinase
VYQVGLTGGIASGKSTVSQMLAARGAVIIDADKVSRDVVEPGTTGLEQVVEEFGEAVLAADGSLDRDALGEIVFADAEANTRLKAILYPEIGGTIAERIEAERGTDNIVVLDAALLVESGWQGLGTLIVVAADPDRQRERMLADRGMSDADADARMRAQASVKEKIAQADLVIWNNGSIEDLEHRVDEIWRDLVERRDAAKAAGEDDPPAARRAP